MLIRHAAVDRRARANEMRDAALAGFYRWKGVDFQVDLASRAAISARALKVLRNPQTVEWRTALNENYVFSAEDFLAFADAVDTYVEGVMRRCWAMKSGLSG